MGAYRNPIAVMSTKVAFRLAKKMAHLIDVPVEEPISNYNFATTATALCHRLGFVKTLLRSGQNIPMKKILAAVKHELDMLDGTVKIMTANVADLLERDKQRVKPDFLEFYNDFMVLIKEYPLATLDWRSLVLSLPVGNITLEDVELGYFHINIDLKQLILDLNRSGDIASPGKLFKISCTNAVYVHNDDSSYFHPHVNESGDLCLGEAEDLLYSAIARLSLMDAVDAVASVLKTYNPDSPYAKIEFFGVDEEDEENDTGLCDACGGRWDNDDLYGRDCGHVTCGECNYYCEKCRADSCTDCISKCDCCDEYTVCPSCCEDIKCAGCSNASLCRRCRRRCEACEELVCKDCVDSCEVCNKTLCPSCVDVCKYCEVNICPQCIYPIYLEDERCCKDCYENIEKPRYEKIVNSEKETATDVPDTSENAVVSEETTATDDTRIVTTTFPVAETGRVFLNPEDSDGIRTLPLYQNPPASVETPGLEWGFDPSSGRDYSAVHPAAREEDARLLQQVRDNIRALDAEDEPDPDLFSDLFLAAPATSSEDSPQTENERVDASSQEVNTDVLPESVPEAAVPV